MTATHRPASAAPASNFFQRPLVQDVLPFLTSLTVHAAILVAAVALLVGSARVVRTTTPLEVQALAASTSIVDAGPPGGVRHVGLGDPLRPPTQDEYPEAANGWASRPGATGAMPSLPGAEGEAGDPVIGLSPFGAGAAKGDDAIGAGTGDGTGPLAPFGPGRMGGDVGFLGVNEKGKRGVASVVFVCDASGSMINTFGSLKVQLVRSIVNLKSFQKFNVVFFQDEQCTAFDPGLVFATPENKRRAYRWLDEQTTTGTTNPVPGLEAAFKSNPELVYVLTDADFPDNGAVRDAVKRLNKEKQTRINTIIFVPGDGADDASAGFKDLMKEIARDNGGVYAHVKESDLK